MLRAALGSKNLNQGQYHEQSGATLDQRWALLVNHIQERLITVGQVLYQRHMDLISDCQAVFERKCFDFFCENILPRLRESERKKECNIRASKKFKSFKKRCEDEAAKTQQLCISEEEMLHQFAKENKATDYKTDKQIFDDKKMREKTHAVQDVDSLKKEQVEFTADHDVTDEFVTCFDTVKVPIELKRFYPVDSASKISRKLRQFKELKLKCGSKILILAIGSIE